MRTQPKRNIKNSLAKKNNQPAFDIDDVMVDLPEDEIHTLVPVKMPRNCRFRICPEQNMPVQVASYENRWYLFSIDVVNAYPGKIKWLSYATLYLGITEAGEVFLLPVTEPWSKSPASWRDSLIDAIDIALTDWVEIASNPKKQRFDIVDRKHSRKEPDWPEESFEEILQEAFAGELYVGSVDHPIIDALNDL